MYIYIYIYIHIVIYVFTETKKHSPNTSVHPQGDELCSCVFIILNLYTVYSFLDE